jgi:hypothetical protein
LGPLKKFDIPTLAFAFLYAFVQASAKSGTSAGLSTGGGCFGELAGYTPGMGGSEDGDGKGTKRYGVTGMEEGPGSVSTLILVVVSAEEGGGELELLLPEEDRLGRLDVDDDEVDKGVDGDDDKDEYDEKEDEVGGEGAAEARAAARRMRTAEGHMDVGHLEY